jgi:hypothetical protein
MLNALQPQETVTTAPAGQLWVSVLRGCLRGLAERSCANELPKKVNNERSMHTVPSAADTH